MHVASAISKILHPIPVIIVTSLGAVSLIDAGTNPIKWIGGSLLVILLPLIVYYAYGMRNFGFEDNGNRNRIYGLGLLLASSYTFYMFYAGAPKTFWTTALGVVISGALFGSLNTRTKISVHTGAISGSASVIYSLEPLTGGLIFAFLPLVGWSRVKLDHHTPLQVLAGAIIPPLVFLTVFYLGSS